MKISVIIPAYNASRFIKQTLESVLDQTKKPNEIIVVDDGSTDETGKLAIETDPLVKVIRKTNGGVSSARNCGIQNACGELIAFLDSDDLWFPTKLEKQYAFLKKHPEVGAIIADELNFDSESGVFIDSYLSTRTFAKEIPKNPKVLDKALTWLLKESFVCTSSVLVRSELLYKVGYFDEKLNIAEDRDMWIRLALAQPIAIIPEVLVKVRRNHGANISAIDRTQYIASLQHVIEKHKMELMAKLNKEGSNAKDIYAKNYRFFGNVFWYADQFENAKKAYSKAIFFGQWDLIPFWVACRAGNNCIALMRQIKNLFIK